MSKLCVNCGNEIPPGRGQKNGSQAVHPGTIYCSHKCCVAYRGELAKDASRLLPVGTSRHDTMQFAGGAAEALVTAKLLMMGYEVYTAVTGGARYDMVTEIDGTFYRVQVKSVRRRRSGELFNNGPDRLEKQKYDILANVVLHEQAIYFEPPIESLLRKDAEMPFA